MSVGFKLGFSMKQLAEHLGDPSCKSETKGFCVSQWLSEQVNSSLSMGFLASFTHSTLYDQSRNSKLWLNRTVLVTVCNDNADKPVSENTDNTLWPEEASVEKDANLLILTQLLCLNELTRSHFSWLTCFKENNVELQWESWKKSIYFIRCPLNMQRLLCGLKTE